MTVEDILKEANSQIGTKETPANSNNVKYNTWYYGKKVSGSAYPWCAAFISWLFRNDQKLCKKTASCATMLDWFTKNGQIVKTPQPGDIVFYKYSTNNRKTNHVGIVDHISGSVIFAIEGNTSVTSNDNGGAVMMRKRSANIVAYARPKYDILPKNVDDVTIAKEVIDGKWGTGATRKRKLSEAGYDYATIQSLVNQMLKGGK